MSVADSGVLRALACLGRAGGFIAGYGDLTFDLVGYILAISSALSTAAYVVMV